MNKRLVILGSAALLLAAAGTAVARGDILPECADLFGNMLVCDLAP